MKHINTVRALQLFHVIRFGVAFLIGILLVKLGIGKEYIARYEYFIFIGALISFFWINGILKMMMSQYTQYDNREQKQLLTDVGILLILLAGVMGLLAFASNVFIGFIPSSELSLVIAFVLFTSVGAMSELIFVLKNDRNSILVLGIITYVLQLLMVAIVSYVTRDMYLVIQILVLWSFLRFCYAIFLLKKNGSNHVKWSSVYYVFILSLPLIGDSLLGNAMEYVDGSLVKHFFDEANFVIYRYGARELPFSSLFIVSIGTAALPIMGALMKDGLTLLKSELSKLMVWLFPLSIILMLISPWLFTFFYDEGFLLSSQIFNIYLLVIVSRMIMPHIILISVGKTTLLLYVSIAEFVVNLVLSIILLYWIGILGIPIASLIAYMLNKVFLVYYLDHKFQIPLSDYLEIRKYLIYSGLIIASYFVSLFLNNLFF